MIIKEKDRIIIDILDQVLDSKYWEMSPERKHLSGHMYRNSPYETDDSCGNCDGARCDICKEIIEEPHLEFSIVCNELEEIISKEDVPKDVVKFFTYDDSCKMNYKEYKFIWPSCKALQRRFPEKYDNILKEVNEKNKSS